MNQKAQALFDYIKTYFPGQKDIEIFNLMFKIDQEAYALFMKSLTGTTWVKTVGGVCPLELRNEYTPKGIEVF
jgi:hypothetical protein